MIRLFTVIGPPRSGTKWYAELFTTAESFCYHELTTLIHPYPSNVALEEWFSQQVSDHSDEEAQRRWLLQCYPTYFSRLWERANFGQYVVGNSDCSLISRVPALYYLWPGMKFLLSFRNGIQSVQSDFAFSESVAGADLQRRDAIYGGSDRFVQCCRAWASYVSAALEAKDWLRAAGRGVIVETRLEKMTTDMDEMRRVWELLTLDQWEKYAQRNRALARTIVNARPNAAGPIPWEETWQAWTDEQKRTFDEECGSWQRQLGYPLPRR